MCMLCEDWELARKAAKESRGNAAIYGRATIESMTPFAGYVLRIPSEIAIPAFLFCPICGASLKEIDDAKNS